MRKINKIIWHCSATKEGHDLKTEEIRNDHVQNRGWRDIGYHYVIELDGTVRPGRPLAISGAHTLRHNKDSIGICYVGGLNASGKPKDTRSQKQKQALYDLTEKLLKRFPGATVYGHNDFAAKACPCFDAKSDWMSYTLSLPIAREDIEEEDIEE